MKALRHGTGVVKEPFAPVDSCASFVHLQQLGRCLGLGLSSAECGPIWPWGSPEPRHWFDSDRRGPLSQAVPGVARVASTRSL